MKKKFDSFLETLSETIGEEQAKELDEKLKIHKEENHPPFLGNCLNRDLALHGKKKRKLPIPIVAMFTMLCIFILFTGGRLVYHFAFEIDNQNGYGVIEASEDENDFHYTIVPPDGYTDPTEEIADNVIKIVYYNNGNMIVFMESKEEIQIDTEYVELQSVFLRNGHEAFFYEKNGGNLYWQQGGYFYYLFAIDPTVDLIELASTIQKT